MNKILEDFDEYYSKALKVFEGRSINVDVTHRCLLQCPFCSRQSAAHGKLMIKKSYAYGDLKLEHARNLGNTYSRLTLCGQISDPIYHTNFIEIFKELIKTNCKNIEIHTTGSHKKIEFWKKLYETADQREKNIEVVFGIDGIDEKSSIHRVNQNTNDAFEAMFLGAEYSKNNPNLKITWQYIPFAFNENDLPKAIEICKEKGIKFLLLKSGRFSGENDFLQPPKNKDLYNVRAFAERINID